MQGSLFKRTLTVLAFLASLATFLVFAGGGVFLLAIENSGERSTGALLAIAATLAFALALLLVFRKGFLLQWPRTAVVLAALLAAIPVAALAWASFRFAGLPIGSRMPLLDWTAFAAGAVLAAGALSILLLGYLRMPKAGQRAAAADLAEWGEPSRQRTGAAWAEAPRIDFDADDDDDDVRVTRVRRASATRARG